METTYNIDDEVKTAGSLAKAKTLIQKHLEKKKKKGYKIKAFRLGTKATENNLWILVNKKGEEVAFGKIYAN